MDVVVGVRGRLALSSACGQCERELVRERERARRSPSILLYEEEEMGPDARGNKENGIHGCESGRAGSVCLSSSEYPRGPIVMWSRVLKYLTT
eukprot:6173989-Pleurochrysis_carterae.AAC.1